ncbi:MAG TPA: hypothetical protein DCX06_02220, partial [Opitutae bacterium]|nr:hypothetical protein [Opitutae bacterium]
HHFGKPLQQVIQENAKQRETTTNEDIIKWANAYHTGHAGILKPEVTNGDAIFFDGRLWHGSDNLSKRVERTALLFQFARADVPVRIPNFKYLNWPFTVFEAPLPPCIQVSGKADREINKISERPPVLDSALTHIPAQVAPVDLNTTTKADQILASKALLEGRSDNLLKLSCHYSSLKPDCRPHPPHSHVDEEILIVLRGEATLRYDDPQGKLAQRICTAGAGIYYPTFHRHTIYNHTTEPLIYLMFKWVGAGSQSKEPLSLQTFSVPTLADHPPSDPPYKTERILFGATSQMNAIEAHSSTLLPGGGYDMHADDHDIAIIVLEGTVETTGRTINTGELIWHPANHEHDMWNHSNEAARYVVFEFHGDNCSGDYLSFGSSEQDQKKLMKKRSTARIFRNIKRAIGFK